MSAKSMWVSEAKWMALSSELRKQLCAKVGKTICVKEYASNVTSALRARGEHALAQTLLAELAGECEDAS